MSQRIDQVADALTQVAEEALSTYGGLSSEQLNWRPAAKKWSIAQCFDHLITTHSLYFPLFEKLAAGDVKPTFWQKVSPLSGFFGNFLIRSLDPANVKPMKTTSRAVPSASEIGGDIIDRFATHQQQLSDALKRLPDRVDPASTIVTSPLMGLVTYSLDDTFTILTHHCWRHFNQAKRVMESSEFPATTPASV